MRQLNLRFYLFFIIALSSISNYSVAQKHKIDSLQNLLKTSPAKNDQRATILVNIAALSMQSDIKKSLLYAEEIISFKEKVFNSVTLSGAYRIKAYAYFYLSQFPEAITAMKDALKFDQSKKHIYGIGADYSGLGNIYVTQSKYPEALNYYLKALKEIEKTNKPSDEANILVNIGTVYNEMGNTTQAMSNYEKSLAIFKQTNYYPGQAGALGNIATIYSKRNNINAAIKYSKLALQITDSLGDFRGTARENGNLSKYYGQIGEKQLALNYGIKAIELNKKIANKKSLGVNYQNVSSAYYSLKDYLNAKNYGFKALKIGEELNVTDIRRDASMGLSDIYEAINQPDSALYFYKEYHKLADSINNDKKKSEIIKMDIQYDFDKKELTYIQNQFIANEQLKHQALQIALNNLELIKSAQLRAIQKISLKNIQLTNQEKEKQLILAKNKEKLSLSQVKALSQQQKLDKLELNQLWLYAILVVFALGSVLVYLINLYRIRQLRFKSSLQEQQAEQDALALKFKYQLSESELKAVRSQMNPHFIFNVLNSIEAYIMENDKKTASRLIQKFAVLSRLILENSTKSLVAADKEWKALMLYTELEAMRYNHSFSFNFRVEKDINLKNLLLPPMLIQPLIENAILHGLIVNHQPDAHLEVSIHKIQDGIAIIVTDNGVGIDHQSKNQNKSIFKEKSFGLASIEERIAMLATQENYLKASFKIRQKIEGGTTAIIELPIFTE